MKYNVTLVDTILGKNFTIYSSPARDYYGH